MIIYRAACLAQQVVRVRPGCTSHALFCQVSEGLPVAEQHPGQDVVVHLVPEALQEKDVVEGELVVR